jgi:hypothetical protein
MTPTSTPESDQTLSDQIPPTTSTAVEVDEVGNEIVRYVTPLIAGWLITAVAKHGLRLSTAEAYSRVYPAVSSAYFVIVRYLENKVPAFGRLLGVKKTVKK